MRRQELLNDDEENLRLALDSRLSDLWTTLPGIITSVNYENQTVSVQPTIQAVLTNLNGERENINLPLLVDVPFCIPKCQNFAITLPVKIGDECLVVFSSRCIDGWWQLGQVQKQIELRMHDLSDGFAMLAPTSLPKKLNNYSSENFQIRNTAGDVKIEITPEGVVNINAEEINLTGAVNINGATTIEGGLEVDGIVFGSHVHTGVQAGGSNTGGPV